MKRYKLFSVIWLLIFISSSFAPAIRPPVQAAGSHHLKAARNQPDGKPAPAVELVALRTQNAKVYQWPDGHGYVEIYTDPIHYQDAGGEWKEIDNRLVETFDGKGWENAAGAIRVYLQKTLPAIDVTQTYPDTFLTTFSLGQHSISFSPLGLNPVTGSIRDNTVVYSQVLPDVDLAYEVSAYTLKESLVFHQKPEQQQFAFIVATSGEELSLLDTGAIQMECASGNCPTIAAPSLEDADGASTTSVQVQLQNLGDNRYLLTYKPERAWLDDPERVYPVVLDPTINASTSYDLYLEEGYPNTPTCNSQRNIVVGYDWLYGKQRTRGFVYFDLPTLPNGSVINAASLLLWQYVSDSGYTARVYRASQDWTSACITWTWNNPPAFDSGTVYSSNWISAGTGWRQLDITTLVREWYSGTPNYGLAIIGANEYQRGSYFCSVAAAGSRCGANTNQHHPYAIIEYDADQPIAPALFAIDNTDGDDNYQVTWQTIPNADAYTLEEDDNPDFSSPVTVYSGGNTQTVINGQPRGIWYYRVKATNLVGDSPWSNIKSVEVPNTISGVVQDIWGTPLSRVKMFSNSGAYTQTGDDGRYELRLAASGNYVIAPALPYSECTPQERTVNVTTLDVSGIDFSCLLGPQGTTITGPKIGITNTNYIFTANVTTATLPLTYTWHVDGYAPITQSGIYDRQSSITLTWAITGVNWLTVTVENAARADTATHAITIDRRPDSYEYNDACDTANLHELQAGDVITSYISHFQDWDFYPIEIIAPYTVISVTLDSPANIEVYPDILEGPCLNGVPHRWNNTPHRWNNLPYRWNNLPYRWNNTEWGEGPGSQKTIAYNIGAYPGTYYIFVEGEGTENSWSTLPYTLSVNTWQETPPVDQIGQCRNPALIQPGDVVSDTISSANDIDCFAFNVPEVNSQLTLTLTNVTASDVMNYGMKLYTILEDGTRHYLESVYSSDNTSTIQYNVGPYTGTYYLQVSANGNIAASGNPYWITFNSSVVSHSGVRTLILFNQKAFENRYAESDVAALESVLLQLAADPAVQGEIITVDEDANVLRAYEDWQTDGNLTNPEKANAVADAIMKHLLSDLGGYIDLEYIVIIGGDQMIPHYRIPDYVPRQLQEANYGGDVSAETAIGAAIQNNYYLSDDFYADFNPLYQDGRRIYIPDYGIGRLVESPQSIISFINAFLNSSGVAAQDSLVVGHLGDSLKDQFLMDSSEYILERIQREYDSSRIRSIIGDMWTANDLRTELFTYNPQIAFFNIHANHGELAPPAGSDVVRSDEILSSMNGRIPGSTYYSLGCHSGLNIPNDDDNPHTVTDTVDAMLAHNLNWIAPAGFGLGGDGIVGSERLMVLLNAALFSGETQTIGNALKTAKQRYFQTASNYRYTVEKAQEELILYGLPMYALHTLPDPQGAIPQSAPTEHPTENAATVNYITRTYAPTVERLTNPVGNYFVATNSPDGTGMYVNEGLPIQPLIIDSIGSDVHGVVFRGGTYTVTTGFNPVVARSGNWKQTWQTEDERINRYWQDEEALAGKELLPSPLVWINRLRTLQGVQQRVMVLAGQYRGVDAQEWLYHEVNIGLYSSDSTDWESPSILSVAYRAVNTDNEITVRAEDESGIAAVIVAYTDGNGTWNSVTLADNGGMWIGTIPDTNENTLFMVQVVDNAGNVSIDDNSGQYHTSDQDVTPPNTHAVVCCSAPGNDGWYLDDVEVRMTALDDKTGVDFIEYRIDNGDWQHYTAPIPFQGDGNWVLQYRAYDKAGNQEPVHTRQIRIDKIPPIIDISLTPPLPDGGLYHTEVTAILTATDPGIPGVRSGIGYIKFRLNGGAWQTYQAPVTIDFAGNNTLEYYASDAGGNKTPIQQMQIAVDTSQYTLVPLGSPQVDALTAYSTIFQQINRGKRPLLLDAPVTIDGSVYPTGTMVLAGNYAHSISGSTVVTQVDASRAHVLYSGSVAVFESSSNDERASWEVVDFQRLFQTYLGMASYHIVDEADLANGLSGIDLLVFPAGLTDDVIARLDNAGAWDSLLAFVYDGGWIYAQGDSMLLLEDAGLVPEGTVGAPLNLNGNMELSIERPDLVLSYNWSTNRVATFKDAPSLLALDDVIPVARFADGDQPAILLRKVGNGGVVLMAPHPTQDYTTYPLVLDAVLLAQSKYLYNGVSVQQQYYPGEEHDVIPAFEIGVPLEISRTYTNHGPALEYFTHTEIISRSFALTALPSVSTGHVVTQSVAGCTKIIWTVPGFPPGEQSLTYQVRTIFTDTLKKGDVVISTAVVSYTQENQQTVITPEPAIVRAETAALIFHISDSSPNVFYPFPSDGVYVHVRDDIANKLNTRANNLFITTTVPLLDLARDAFDQTTFSVIEDTGENIWFMNHIMGYPTNRYPVPIGAWDTSLENDTGQLYSIEEQKNYLWYYSLDDWDCHTWVRIPNPARQSVTIPPELDGLITQDPDNGDLWVPGKTLVFDLGTLLAYDSKSPAIRYRIHSTELYGRSLSVSASPVPGTTVVSGNGFSVYTRAGQHPVSAREYLSTGQINNPIPSTPSRLTYTDIWGRSQVITTSVTADFYDVIPPGPGPGAPHHVRFNSTYGMFDESGQPLYDIPTYQVITLTLVDKVQSVDFDIDADELIIQHWLPRGLRYDIQYVSWESNNDSLVLVDRQYPSVPAFEILNFQGDFDANTTGTITITARLKAYPENPMEGDYLVDGGAHLFYRDHTAGPSQYNATYTNVYVDQGYQTDITTDKWVGPVGVSTHGDTVFEVVTVQDPREPHLITDDVFMNATPGTDKTAQVQVGMSWLENLYYATVSPGGETMLCLRLANNTGRTWGADDLDVIALPSPGITLTKVFTGTEAPPNLYDQPYMWAKSIPDASRGVYCWKAEIGFSVEGGVTYPIDFTLVGTDTPSASEFPMPQARIGVENVNSSNVYQILGQSHIESLTDRVPVHTTPLEAKPLTTEQEQELRQALVYDFAHGTDTARAYFDSLPGDIPFVIGTESVSSTEKTITYTLPISWSVLPHTASDNVIQSQFKFVILTQLDELLNGRQPVNDGVTVDYIDDFNRYWEATSNRTSVVVHGPVITGTYTLVGVTSPSNPGDYLEMIAGEENLVQVDIAAWNVGDYVALTPTLRITLTEGVHPITSEPLWTEQNGQVLTFTLPHILPYDSEHISLTVTYTPTTDTTVLGPIHLRDDALVQLSWIDYVDGYANADVSNRLGGIYTVPVVQLAPVNLLLSSVASHPSMVLPDTYISYTLRLTNTGPADTRFTLVDYLPQGVTLERVFANHKDVTHACSLDTDENSVSCSFPGLQPDETTEFVYMVHVEADTRGAITNTAEVVAAAPETNLNDNFASDTVTVVPSILVYENTFENENTVGSEWSQCRPIALDTTPGGSQSFLGQFGNETTCLSLENLPQHSYVRIAFDLYVIRSWDGNQIHVPPQFSDFLRAAGDSDIGPDEWTLTADEDTLLHTTFSNWDMLGFTQAYPGEYNASLNAPAYPARTGAAENNTLGYTFGEERMDATYPLQFVFPHSTSTLRLSFTAFGLQALDDESWGVDNIQVYVVTQPLQTFLPLLMK